MGKGTVVRKSKKPKKPKLRAKKKRKVYTTGTGKGILESKKHWTLKEVNKVIFLSICFLV